MATLWLVIQREFVSNVLTSRFMIGFLICLMSTAAAVFVQVEDYEKRLAAYHTAVQEHQEATQTWDLYSQINPKAHRKPNPLSIFNVGVISTFIFFGLFFSSRVSNAITSLVWLLLTWVCLAFIFPSLLGLFVGTLDPIPSIERVSAEKRLQLANIDDEFRPAEMVKAAKLSEAPSVDNPSATRLWATYFRERSEVQTRIADTRVDQQLRQMQLTRELTQISPTVCFQYAMEGLANTGIASYMNFVKQVRRYRSTFIKTFGSKTPIL